jgi:hypothetical protein
VPEAESLQPLCLPFQISIVVSKPELPWLPGFVLVLSLFCEMGEAFLCANAEFALSNPCLKFFENLQKKKLIKLFDEFMTSKNQEDLDLSKLLCWD